MKVDDDVFVNPGNLLKTLESTELLSVRLNNTDIDYALIGKVHNNIRVVRAEKHKFYLSRSAYPDERYPPYLQGSAYVFTGSLLSPLYSCALDPRTPLIPFEDVFITGLCTRQLNLLITHRKEFLHAGIMQSKKQPQLYTSETQKIKTLSRFSTVHIDPSVLETMWWEKYFKQTFS